MKNMLSTLGEMIKLIFIGIPLALAIYVGLHIGFIFYIIYKKFK